LGLHEKPAPAVFGYLFGDKGDLSLKNAQAELRMERIGAEG
jgi:hypothetical protein